VRLISLENIRIIAGHCLPLQLIFYAIPDFELKFFTLIAVIICSVITRPGILVLSFNYEKNENIQDLLEHARDRNVMQFSQNVQHNMLNIFLHQTILWCMAYPGDSLIL